MGEINSSLNYLEENFSKLEDIAIETIQNEALGEKRQKNLTEPQGLMEEMK